MYKDLELLVVGADAIAQVIFRFRAKHRQRHVTLYVALLFSFLLLCLAGVDAAIEVVRRGVRGGAHRQRADLIGRVRVTGSTLRSRLTSSATCGSASSATRRRRNRGFVFSRLCAGLVLARLVQREDRDAVRGGAKFATGRDVAQSLLLLATVAGVLLHAAVVARLVTRRNAVLLRLQTGHVAGVHGALAVGMVVTVLHTSRTFSSVVVIAVIREDERRHGGAVGAGGCRVRVGHH
mmetsp:Transcript_8592/g.14502  ORF Transcript_8592/g.14502 Transcript_8592/m.14502 type:complete len:236 (-) Transcript_8592:1062-1769(-)